MEVSVMGCFINSCQCQPMHPSLVLEGQSCVSQPVYSCKLNQFVSVGMSCQMWALCEAFRKWNGFGDDVIADHPYHPSLHVHNTVCHVSSDSVVMSCLIWCGMGGQTVAHKERGQHTGVLVWHVVCVIVWWSVMCVQRKKSCGLVG